VCDAVVEVLAEGVVVIRPRHPALTETSDAKVTLTELYVQAGDMARCEDAHGRKARQGVLPDRLRSPDRPRPKKQERRYAIDERIRETTPSPSRFPRSSQLPSLLAPLPPVPSLSYPHPST